jgi:hypothetical protein
MQKKILELVQSRHSILGSGVGEHLDMGPVVLLQCVFCAQISTYLMGRTMYETYGDGPSKKNPEVQWLLYPPFAARKWCGVRGQRSNSSSWPFSGQFL